LERNQDPFQEFEIRQRDDSAALNRMETGRDEDMEDSRRTLRSRGELQGENGNETREGNADQSQRSSGTSRSNVANTERQRLEGFSEHSTTIGGQDKRTQFGNESSRSSQSRDVADTNGERSQRTKQSETYRGETETQLSTTQSITTEGNHWEFEPDVGRVAYGIPGRVHRLKALGNSIVPKIVEEIGYALIKGMK